MPSPQKWYEIKAQATGRAEIYIFGVVVDYKSWDEDDVTAMEFIRSLKGLGDIDLHINSPGGSVPAGNAIYNALRRHAGDVTVYVDGLAASIASVIAMAGNRVIMPDNAMLMIHDPWSYTVGNATEMRKAADMLDKFKVGMVAAYREKSGMDEARIEQLMGEETWITAAEAAEMGLADTIEAPLAMAACFDLSRYKNVPRALASLPPARATGSTPQPTKEQTMDIHALREQHPDLVAQVEAEARAGYIPQAAAETATTAAVAAENARILDLVQAAIGEEDAGKIRTAAAKGLTAEDLQGLGVSLAAQPAAASDEATRAALLAAITQAAPQGLQGAAASGEAVEQQAAVSAIAAGGSVK